MSDVTHPPDDSPVALALDDLPASEAATLSEHLAGCARCRAEYDSISRSIEAALAAAPGQAPPAGFESRVLSVLSPRRRRTPWLVAAAVVVALAAGGLLGANLAGRSPGETLAGARLVTGSGEAIGTVTPSRYGGADVLVLQVREAPPGTRYECRLRFADGHTEEAGYWTVPPSGWGVWVARFATGAQSVELVSDTGQVWSTADLG